MHIVHVGVTYQPETLDGATRAVSAYAPFQVEAGHRVTFVRFKPNGPYESTAVDGLTNVRLPVGRFRWWLGGDVYHFHTSYARTCLAARRLRVPYVVSTHGIYLEEALARRRLWNLVFQRLLGLRHLQRAAFVHAITPNERSDLEAYAGPLHTEILPNSLLLPVSFDAEARVATRAALGVTEDELLVVFLGRFDVPGKGLDVLVEGFRQACAAHPERRLRLHFVGPHAGVELRAIIPPALQDRISLAPAVFGEEKRAILSAGDVFATLSRWDVMPTAILDALTAGLPLLVTEETGFGDFVRQYGTGRVVRHDAGEVAEALAGFETGSLLAARPARIESALAEYHPRKIAQRFIALYEQYALAGKARV